MIKSPVEFFRTLPKKVCPECGQTVKEQAESYLMECDRCLSKKMEQKNETEGFMSFRLFMERNFCINTEQRLYECLRSSKSLSKNCLS